MEKNSWFNPDTSFLRLPVVITSIVVIFLIAALSAASITYFDNLWLSWDGSYQGFKRFLVYYQFPLGTLALLVPIGGVLAINHRSEQTKHQFKLTQQQNIFNNYYKHLEEFEKYISSHHERLNFPEETFAGTKK